MALLSQEHFTLLAYQLGTNNYGEIEISHLMLQDWIGNRNRKKRGVATKKKKMTLFCPYSKGVSAYNLFVHEQSKTNKGTNSCNFLECMNALYCHCVMLCLSNRVRQ